MMFHAEKLNGNRVFRLECTAAQLAVWIQNSGGQLRMWQAVKASKRVARDAERFHMPWNLLANSWWARRFSALWQARNRRTRVLMWRVREANDRLSPGK